MSGLLASESRGPTDCKLEQGPTLAHSIRIGSIQDQGSRLRCRLRRSVSTTLICLIFSLLTGSSPCRRGHKRVSSEAGNGRDHSWRDWQNNVLLMSVSRS